LLSRTTEGVGFEPTVGFPTLDFESSALNRTQPPFREAKRRLPTLNAQLVGYPARIIGRALEFAKAKHHASVK
jgi:hypothetical protein